MTQAVAKVDREFCTRAFLNRCVSANPRKYAEENISGSHSKFLGSCSLLTFKFGGSHWLPRQKMQIHTSEELAKKKSCKISSDVAMANWQNPFTAAWDRSCDLSLPNMSPCPACNREHWSQPQRRVRMSTRSILGYILSRWPTWRTVAKNSQRRGHLQCAVCSARPLAND